MMSYPLEMAKIISIFGSVLDLAGAIPDLIDPIPDLPGNIPDLKFVKNARFGIIPGIPEINPGNIHLHFIYMTFYSVTFSCPSGVLSCDILSIWLYDL